MDSEFILSAEVRQATGKAATKAVRRDEKIPAVFYGPNTEAIPLAVNYREFKRVVLMEGSSRNLFQLRIAKEGGYEDKTVTLKDYQVDPLKRTMTHVDFYEVDVTKTLEIEVPLVLEGKPIGVERGGMLQQVRRTLLISALPAKLPEQIVVDVSGMDLGDSLHVEDINLGEGVSAIYDVNFTLVTLATPKGMDSEEEEEEEEGAEGEEAEATE